MKILLIATVVALVALSNAVRVLHQNLDQEQSPEIVKQNRQNLGQQNLNQGQRVGQGGGQQQQLRQCTCEEQYKGMHEWKDFFRTCSSQCRLTENDQLKSIIDSPVKLYSCIDRKVEVIHHLFDCINSQLIQEDSCVTDMQESQSQMLPYQDFRQLFVNNFEPLVDEIHNTYEELDPKFMDKYGYIFLDNCSGTCLFDKIQQAPVWEQIKCLPKIDDSQMRGILQQCYRDIKYKDMIQSICTCSVGVGVKELLPFCGLLRTTEFPEWAQSQDETQSQGLLSDQQRQQQQQQSGQLGRILAQSGQLGQFDQSEQIGQSGQWGQLGRFGQYLIRPKLFVKLAIEEEQPIPIGLIGGLRQGIGGRVGDMQGQQGLQRQSQNLGGGIDQEGSQSFSGGFNQGGSLGQGGRLGGGQGVQGQSQGRRGGFNQGQGGFNQGVSQGQGGGLGSTGSMQGNFQSGQDEMSFL
jgi:hypothetical protein